MAAKLLALESVPGNLTGADSAFAFQGFLLRKEGGVRE